MEFTLNSKPIFNQKKLNKQFFLNEQIVEKQSSIAAYEIDEKYIMMTYRLIIAEASKKAVLKGKSW